MKLSHFAKLLFVLMLPFALFMGSGCKKDNFSGDAITFSTDTLTFDTVFTVLGSTTKKFKVFNNSRDAVTISNINLSRLTGQQFRIMVDGVAGDNFTNVEIPGRDSIYVFVEVTVNPNDQSQPFVIIDDVSFLVNDDVKKVHLQAFGQNAHFHYGEELDTNGTVIWNNDLPHVIVNGDSVPGVYVRCGTKLKIQPGCKIFLAGGAAMYIEGELEATASNWSDSIVFQGVRLEQYYDDQPGQWSAIIFLRNSTCQPKGTFDHCVINESSYGIYAGAGLSTNINDYLSTSNRANVTINNTIVKNSLYHAVYGFNAEVNATNSLFYVSGDHLVNLTLGGDYNFLHCTMYNAGSRYISHEKEVLNLNNALVDNNTNTIYQGALSANFTNSVIWGSLRQEVAYNNYPVVVGSSSQYALNFLYNDIKTNIDTVGLYSISSSGNYNDDPRFKDAAKYNFIPSDSTGYFSPLIDRAPGLGATNDIFGTMRPVSKTGNADKYDVGAVEVP
ncbi:MAG: hypothetical protein JST49_12630 [Bacteroidetes bacterium]|nr:hypothetical protein [Bacteroidota bacterium]